MPRKRVNPEPEISFAAGVPLIPNVRPVIILSGSDYDMGYQYYQQVVQIFGPWILDSVKHAKFTDKELANLKAFQRNIREYTPEFIDFFKGMAAGATDAGVPLSYQEVLAALTTTESYPGAPPGSEDEQLPPTGCSGWAAWGSATKDGKLICGGQMEASPQFSDTIIAFPKDGNRYIHSPVFIGGTKYMDFGFSFWGFPTMNNKGLTFVHHGNTYSNPREEVTYGIPMGMQIMHTVRYADNAARAFEMLLAYPRQFVWGITNGGGFWADTGGDAFVFESVENPFVVRRAGYVGERDFLYATNNRLCKEMGGIGMCEGKVYVPHAGWADFQIVGSVGRNLGKDAVERNLGMWNLFHNYHGEIDLGFARMAWRFPAQTPGSKESEYRICNLNVAGLGIALPDDGDEGSYYVSTGYPSRISYIPAPNSHSFRIAPTFSFYHLKLASSPEQVMTAAMLQAQHDLHYANQELRKLTYWDSPYAPLDEIYNKAAIEWFKGSYYQGLARKATGNERIYDLSKATRGFTRCQAFARQVYDALVPPATKPEDLGLRPWFGDWGDWATK